MISVKVSGLDKLVSAMNKAPKLLQDNLHTAMGQSMLMAETEAKRLTPVDTSNLRGSIAGSGGYSFNDGLRGGFGTNVKYAFFVEVRDNVKHKIGQAHYMETGAENSLPFVQKIMEKLMKTVGDSITSI